MKMPRRLALFIALSLSAGSGHAAGVSIGVVAPQGGNFAELGRQIAAGAAFGATAAKNTVIPIDEACTEGSGAAVAEALVTAKVQIAVGFLCTETLEGALPRLKDAGIPAITVSVRSRILMEDALKNGWPLFRLAPVEGSEAGRVVDVILKNWAAQPLALIDDGTIHGREVVGAVRSALEDKGMKPVFVDTYRPGQEQQIGLVRRLKKAGAAHVFVGGDRSDVAIIARDAAAEHISLGIMGDDAMRAANQPVALAEGVLAMALPNYEALEPNVATTDSLRQAGTEPEGYFFPADAAASIAGKAVETALAGNSPLGGALVGPTFDTAVGPVAFGANHEMNVNPYRLLEWRGNAFVPVDPSTE